jgi:hypothetical protein
VSSFYVNLAATAQSLLTRYGESVTFSRETTSAFDPASGIVTSSTSTFDGLVAKFNYRSSEIDGETIKMGDVRLVASISTEPQVDDSVVLDGLSYRVMNVENIKPAGTNVIYKLQVRK